MLYTVTVAYPFKPFFNLLGINAKSWWDTFVLEKHTLN